MGGGRAAGCTAHYSMLKVARLTATERALLPATPRQGIATYTHPEKEQFVEEDLEKTARLARMRLGRGGDGERGEGGAAHCDDSPDPNSVQPEVNRDRISTRRNRLMGALTECLAD